MLRFQNEADFEAFSARRAGKLKPAADPGEIRQSKALRTSKKHLSPHAVAMAYLASHPEDFQGNQEHYEQCRIFHTLELERPEIYEELYAVPNGEARSKRAGGRIKAQGQKKGSLDMNLDVARGSYHGLRIELKWGKNTASPEQKETIARHTRNGYLALVVTGADLALQVIKAYWVLQPGDTLEVEA